MKDNAYNLVNNGMRINIAYFFIILFVLSSAFIGKPDSESGRSINGKVTIEMTWPSDIPSDVDMWIKTPVDEKPINYARTVGKTLTLMKDDKGINSYDLTDINYELAVMQESLPGEYTVNIVIYGFKGFVGEIPVTVVITEFNSGNVVFTRKEEKILSVKDEHKTMFNFRVNDAKVIVMESINNRYKNIGSS